VPINKVLNRIKEIFVKPFPKEVLIQMTVERAMEEIDMDDYNEGSSQLDEMIGVTIGESIHPVTIESWDDIPEGYELASEEDIEDYEENMENK
jgi:hypothetical protein